jgi:exonuclease 1
VITEDSDLLVYGVTRAFYKFDKDGKGTEIDLGENFENLKKIKSFDFSKFDQEMFITMCILSGCDYLESIKGIGFKKA